jgi:hypothetical protein
MHFDTGGGVDGDGDHDDEVCKDPFNGGACMLKMVAMMVMMVLVVVTMRMKMTMAIVMVPAMMVMMTIQMMMLLMMMTTTKLLASVRQHLQTADVQHRQEISSSYSAPSQC